MLILPSKYSSIDLEIEATKKLLGKNSISGENEVIIPTTKRIISGLEHLNIMRF